MACTQTFNGIARNCTPSIGGVKEVYIANYDEVTLGIEGEDPVPVIASVTGTFKKYEMRRESGALTSTISLDPKTHTRYVTSEVTLVFAHMDEEKRAEVEKIINGDVAVIVRDANGKCWYLGAYNPVNVSGGTAQTGTAAGDANNYTLTLQDVSPYLPQDVTPYVADLVK